MEKRESVQNLVQVQKITFDSHVLGCTTFASTLVTLHICGLIIVVDVDLVTLASLSRVKESGRSLLLGSSGTCVVVFADFDGILDLVCSAVEMACCGRPSTGCCIKGTTS